MIELAAERIALKLKRMNPEETASVEVMKYALTGILQNTLTIIAALMIGFMIDTMTETLIAAFSLLFLRLFSGGFHFKSSRACLIFSALAFVSATLISVQTEYLILINSISLVLALLYAPSNITEHIRVSPKYFPVFKGVSILIITTNFFILSSVVGWAFLIQSLTLIHISRKEAKT